MKIFSIFLIIFGFMGIIAKDYFLGLSIITLGIILFMRSKKKRKNKKQLKVKDANIPIAKAISKESFIFRVSGVTMNGRQEIIKEIVRDWKEYNPDDIYEGLTNKEIKEEWDSIYEVDIEDWCDVVLIPEPDNSYDSNAIKVESDFGLLGYVPEGDAKKVKSILGKNYDLSWRVIGGKYKYFDVEEEEVLTETLIYGVEITLTY